MRAKITIISLVIGIAFCMPETILANPIKANESTISLHLNGPKKKVKKKRKHPLDRKTKMKNGKHCPSF